MGIYSYYCEKCKTEHEELFSLKHRPDFVSCPTCKKKAKYVMSAARFEVHGANAANRYSSDSNYKWFGAPGSEQE